MFIVHKDTTKVMWRKTESKFTSGHKTMIYTIWDRKTDLDTSRKKKNII